MTKKILIVEDQILIADTIARYLKTQDYEIVGIAISYQKAIKLFQETSPDIALIDIHLYSKETGIDFASYLSEQPNPIPFIFLTAQLDKGHIENAKLTRPAGYLPKPISKATLLASVEIALHNHEHQQKQTTDVIHLSDGEINHRVPMNKILFLQANHVYVEVQLLDSKRIITRSSLRDLLEILPSESFIQTHRSYCVNIAHINRWDSRTIYTSSFTIPISRSYYKTVLQKLNAHVIQNK